MTVGACHNKKVLISCIVVLLVINSYFIGYRTIIKGHKITRLSSDPISLDGNEDLHTTVVNNGWIGDGTPNNPYIIHNHSFERLDNPIIIKNTDKYIVIDEVYINNAHKCGIYFFNTSNITVMNTVIDNCSQSIVWNEESNNINYINIISNSTGEFVIFNSKDVSVEESYFYNTMNYGSVGAVSSRNILIKNNYCEINNIRIKHGSDNRIINNTMASHLYIEEQNNSMIKNNILFNKSLVSRNNYIVKFYSNKMYNGGFRVSATDIDNYSIEIPRNNTVNDKPVLFLKNMDSNMVSNEEVGQIIIANTTNFDIHNISIDSVTYGIQISHCKNIRMDKVSINNTRYGIFLTQSDTIEYDNISINNTDYAIGGTLINSRVSYSSFTNIIRINGYAIQYPINSTISKNLFNTDFREGFESHN